MTTPSFAKPSARARATPQRFDGDAALRSIFAGTAAETGKQFFAALVKNLAQAMNTHGAWVTEYFPETNRLRALAFWLGGKFIPHFEHNIAGTVCERVIQSHGLVHFPRGVFEVYPSDPLFLGAGVESYMGVPLLDINGKVLGHLAIVDTRPMPMEPRAVAIFKIFAARAMAELQRLYIEAELRDKNAQLEKAQAQLEAENKRKSEELEKARRLQFALLPQQLPQMRQLEMALHMKTATEVSGDYYDYQLSREGALTVTIGDATGHGLHAGMMVIATKSILATLRDEPDLSKMFTQMHRAIKQVNLAKHYMGLQVLRVRDYTLEVCSAGMPPLLLYRAATQRVEEVLFKSMPLGSFGDSVYEKRLLHLAPGDTIVLMSDGLLERFNEHHETLGETRLQAVLAAVAQRSPQEIIARLLQAGAAWANGTPQHDDITLIVLQMK